MLLFWLVLAVTVPDEDDSRKELANTDEIRHEVSFKLIAPDAAMLTVTRAFAPRSPGEAMRLDRQLGLPDQSVVTSFAFRSDGTWREGRLGPKSAIDRTRNKNDKNGHPPPPARTKPWASFEGRSFRAARLATPSFHSAEGVQIRYTLWVQAEATRGGRRWVYCGGDQNDADKDEKVLPQIALTPGQGDLRVLPDPESESCVVIEKTEPAGSAAPSARFGVYRLGPSAWWWRLELAVPENAAALPTPPETAPVVFVLDASRSQESNGGIAHQLAIVESYLANTPSAEVELVLTNRTAKRVFDRFVPAGGFKPALPVGLEKRSLANGSFLDRGVELAVEALIATGKPGRIVLMTDGAVPSRFQRSAVVATLRRAPPGTIVHVLYPSTGTSNEAISHNVPEGLDELAAAFGGGSYSVTVARNRKDGSLRPPTPKMLRGLVKPEGLESLRLHDVSNPQKADATEWPDWLDDDHAGAGEGRVWSGVSETPPPKRLALTGWVWAKKVQLAIRPDPTLQQRLARLAVSDDEVMECEETTHLRKDALAQRFLAPALTFLVAGEGPAEDIGSGGIALSCNEGSDGGGKGEPPPKAQELVPHLGNVLRRCGLAPDPGGTIQVKIETHRLEILDVAIAGGEDWQRQCLEDGIWAVNLPSAFNEGHAPPVEYALTLARNKPAPAARP